MPGLTAAMRSRKSTSASLVAALAALALLASPAPVPAQDAAPAAFRPAAVPAAARPPVRAPARAPAAGFTLADVVVHTELPITQWLRPGEFAWNDDNVPAGPTTIVVNIRARTLSAYRAGVEIGRSSILYGTDGKPTPTGAFTIIEKKARHFSTIYRGAPMPHMLRLTMDGIAIHGAAEMGNDIATHGCVGLPQEFAALLFGSARVGDRVLIWQGDKPPAA